MTDKPSQQFYVQVVDKNFQANIQSDLGIKLDKPMHDNEFMDNSDQDEYNNKPATPLKKSTNQLQHSSQSQDQPSDQQPNYQLSKVLPKLNQKQRLIEQNIKLKAQIYELAKQLDQILEKDKTKKKKFGLNIIEEEDELIRDKRLEIKKQQLQIMELKNKIFVAKRQLDSVYNNFVVTERENLIKKLNHHLKELQKQKHGLVNITQQQDKVLKVVQNQQEYGQKLQKTKQQYHHIKTQTRQIVLKTQQKQKILKKYHSIYIDKLTQLKDIEQKLSINKQKSKLKKTNPQNKEQTQHKDKEQTHLQTITEDIIKSFEEQVKDLEIKKKQGEKDWQDKIKLIDLELYKKRLEQQKKMLILREKQKELKLNELRIKELRKMFRENQNAQKNEKKPDMDMSQFRHKRNIRYIEK